MICLKTGVTGFSKNRPSKMSSISRSIQQKGLTHDKDERMENQHIKKETPGTCKMSVICYSVFYLNFLNKNSRISPNNSFSFNQKKCKIFFKKSR